MWKKVNNIVDMICFDALMKAHRLNILIYDAFKCTFGPFKIAEDLTIMYRKRYKMHTIGAKLEQDKMYALRMTFLPNFRRFPLSFDSNFIVLFSFMNLLSMKMAFIIDRMSHTFRLWNEWIDEHPKQTCTNRLLASCGDFGLDLAYISTEYSTHFKWTSVYKYTNMMHTNK